MNSNQSNYLILGLSIIGYAMIVTTSGWWTGVGVFLVHWAVNVERRQMKAQILKDWAAGIAEAVKGEQPNPRDLADGEIGKAYDKVREND